MDGLSVLSVGIALRMQSAHRSWLRVIEPTA